MSRGSEVSPSVHKGSYPLGLLHQPLHNPISSIFTIFTLEDYLSRHFSINLKWEIHNLVLNDVFAQWEMSAWEFFAS